MLPPKYLLLGGSIVRFTKKISLTNEACSSLKLTKASLSLEI